MVRTKTFEEYKRQRINTDKRLKELEAVLNGFNSETHVIVTKEQLDLTRQLQALTAIATSVEDVQTKVNEVHAVQTGALYKVPTRLTAKQKKQAEDDAEMAHLQSLRANAHRKIINGVK